MLGWRGLGRRKPLLLAYGALLLVALAAVVSCQLVAGVETRKLDPIASGCALPSGSGPLVRVANLVPADDVVDVCIRVAGASSWGRPIIRDGGTDCPSKLPNGAAGFAYSDVSIAFNAPSTSVDVKMIAAGDTCSGGAVTEGDGLTLTAGPVTTLMRIGGNGAPQQIVALQETDKTNPQDTRLRFVHAMPGTAPLDLGITKDQHLPTTITSLLLSGPVAFGATATNQNVAIGTLESDGYASVPSIGYPIGAALDGGSGKAILQINIDARNSTASLYAIGVSGDNKHPPRGLYCDEGTGAGSDGAPSPGAPLLLGCAPSPLPTLSIDVFNPALYGPNAPFEDQRRPPNSAIPQAIAGAGSDLMCLVEIDRVEDRNAIVQAAKGAYPYSYLIDTDLSTPFTDPSDQNGQTPPAPTSPPCGGGVPSADVDAVFTCMEQFCSTKGPGDSSGFLQSSTTCLVNHCAGQFLTLQSDSHACFDCVVDYVASQEQWGTSKSACETDARAPLGFTGQTSMIILSRYPLNNTDKFIFPSTNYRRAALYAQVALEDQTVDFYCGFLITTLIASDLPYIGNYGGGNPDAGSQTAYENEQLLEANKLVNWVGQKSQGKNPAIIVGDWRSGFGSTADAGAFASPTELAKNTIQLLSSKFTPVSAPNWVPQCNYCPVKQNVYNGQDSYFVEQPFLTNWPSDATTAVTDESLIFTDKTLQINGVDAGLAPISPYYGLQIRVLRPQQ